MESLPLFGRALSSPTMCRFIPALSVLSPRCEHFFGGPSVWTLFFRPFSSSSKGKLAKTRLFRNDRISVMPEPSKQRVESRLAATMATGKGGKE
jgi:hypothetical protein